MRSGNDDPDDPANCLVNRWLVGTLFVVIKKKYCNA